MDVAHYEEGRLAYHNGDNSRLWSVMHFAGWNAAAAVATAKRLVAVGRCENGRPYRVTVPADWPTEDEVGAIVERNARFDELAACVRSLFDEDDWAQWAPLSEVTS